MVYTERAEMAADSCGTSHASAVSTLLGGYSKQQQHQQQQKTKQTKNKTKNTRYKKLFTDVESHASGVSLFDNLTVVDVLF